MELPSSIDSMQPKNPEPRVRINELPDLTPSRSSGSPPKTSHLRRANTVAQAGNIIKRNLELKASREKSATAGPRAKDSNELLKAPLQRSQTHRGETRPAERKAGHFTVGSVGQNGKIFLRYDR